MSVQLDPRSLAEPAELLVAPMALVERFMDDLVERHAEGTCAAMVREHLATGGKRLRAALALDAFRALGGQPADAVAWAAACELLHNASLVHDDLQDGDRVRRGAPALWTTWGAHQAINAGDLMLMLPTLALEHLETSGERKWALAQCVARYAARTACGQSNEMSLRGDVLMDREAYVRSASGKTAGLFGMPVEGAALLAGRSVNEARRLARPFETLGLLFQVQDDVLDLFGEKGRGEVGADVREGKISALAVAHVELHPEDRLWLASILRTPRERTSDEAVAEVIARFADGGALDVVLRRIRTLEESVRSGVVRHDVGLTKVAEMLLDRVLRPISHLLDARRH
jgi:geranylgeranyl diphosphate synthase type I